MFVQATTSSRKNGKTYVSYLVRESFRTPNGPPLPHRLQHHRPAPPTPATSSPPPSRARTSFPPIRFNFMRPWTTAGLAVLNDAWSRFRLAELFADIGSPVNAASSKPSSIAACSFPAPSSLWLRKLRAPGWLKPAAWRPPNPLMRTISTPPWISSTAIG